MSLMPLIPSEKSATGLYGLAVSRRKKQITPAGDWAIWLFLRVGDSAKLFQAPSHRVVAEALGNVSQIALVGPTFGHVRDT